MALLLLEFVGLVVEDGLCALAEVVLVEDKAHFKLVEALVGSGGDEASEVFAVAACFKPVTEGFCRDGFVALCIVAAGVKTTRENGAEASQDFDEVAFGEAVGGAA
jgi:hypothetical protein